MREIVNTKYGQIRGVVLSGRYDGIVEFRGVPYAKPPVGELRWKPPVELDKWEGVKDCTAFTPVPIQFYSIESQGLPMDEDCLYMVIDSDMDEANVKKPVFVWFHGGALENGAHYSLDSSKASLSKRGCVVVSVEQRLNIFGYMALPQLSKEQGGKSGNYGLMDEIMALKWIRENIEAFGGDPDSITVGGQSGGTDKLVSLAASPVTKGWIKGIICESGLKWAQTYQSLEKKEKSCQNYLEEIGINPSISLDDLRKMDAKSLLKKKKKGSHGEMVRDNELIMGNNTREILDLQMEGINVICGSNFGEAKVMKKGLTKEEMKKTPQYNVHSASEFYDFYKELLGNLYEEFDFEKLVPVTDENANYTMRMLASMGLTPPIGNNSSRSLMIGRIFGEHVSKLYPESSVYTYLFNMIPKTNSEHKGWGRGNISGNAVYEYSEEEEKFSWHGCEMDYAYNCLEMKTDIFDYVEKDYEVAELMNSYWINFIKKGNPNGEGLPDWPSATDNFGYIVIGNETCGYEGLSDLDKLVYRFVSEYFPA